MYNYKEAIMDDIRAYIHDEITLADYGSRETLEDCLHDELWTVDSVTGNASGSYTFSAWAARENICHNMHLLVEAIEHFSADALELLDDPEKADVTIRCYLLGECIAAVLDEMGV